MVIDTIFTVFSFFFSAPISLPVQVFYSFDKLILMADGCMVYTGPPSKCLQYLARVGYVPPMDYNPADFIMDLVTSTEAGAAQVCSG